MRVADFGGDICRLTVQVSVGISSSNSNIIIIISIIIIIIISSSSSRRRRSKAHSREGVRSIVHHVAIRIELLVAVN